MPTTTAIILAKPSPMRMLRAWLFRERAVRGPAAIELDVVDRQITREEASIAQAVGESSAVENRLQKVRNEVRTALTDGVTPGVIDTAEARAICRHLIGTAVAAHKHTKHLEELR